MCFNASVMTDVRSIHMRGGGRDGNTQDSHANRKTANSHCKTNPDGKQRQLRGVQFQLRRSAKTAEGRKAGGKREGETGTTAKSTSRLVKALRLTAAILNTHTHLTKHRVNKGPPRIFYCVHTGLHIRPPDTHSTTSHHHYVIKVYCQLIAEPGPLLCEVS